MLEDGQEDPAQVVAPLELELTQVRRDKFATKASSASSSDSAGPDELDALPGHAAVYNTFNVQWHLTSRSTHRAFQTAARTAWKVAATSGE
jgi:hypothetical protein